MQPLKITIYGNFWDVQIYKGRLYLWDMNGDLYIYNWEELIENIYSNDKFLKLPIVCGFLRGDYLYNNNFNLIYGDVEIKNSILHKFKKASSKENFFNLENMPLRAKQENPFRELQTDSEIYYNNIYAATQKGLLLARAHRSSKKYPVTSRFEKIWDCPNIQSVRANSKRLLLSGGSEGLFEFLIDRENFYPSMFKVVDNKIIQLDKRHSLFSTYAFSSIYNTSDIDGSFLIANYWESGDDSYSRKLKFYKVYNESDIFPDVNRNKGFSWAENEKIYYIKNGYPIKVIGFTQGSINNTIGNNKKIFEIFGDDKSSNKINEEEIVSAGVAQFGTLIEDLNGLTVLQSNGEKYRITGDITRWRVYPRAKQYTNHLHVILDDRIEIYSFNHDYFLEQTTKIYGIKPVKSGN